MTGERVQAASWWRRVLAFVIDLAVLAVVAVPLVLVSVGSGQQTALGVLLGLAAASAVAICQWLVRARRGWTLGQLVLGLRTVDLELGTPIGPARSARRTVVVLAGGLVVGVGALVVLVSPAFDRSGRRLGWHDEFAGAWVVRHRAARSPAPSPGVTTGPTRALPAASAARPAPTGEVPVLAFGLLPELERTRPAPVRHDLPTDAAETYTPVRAELELSDGTWQVVQGTVLVGRNPIAGVGETAVRLRDPLRSLSRSHLRLAVTSDTVQVEDLGSRNGTLALLPGGNQVDCPPGQRVTLPVGTVLRLGDCWLRLVGTSAQRSTFPDVTFRR
jgi:uncharacterized RDD family membrane protein YckC